MSLNYYCPHIHSNTSLSSNYPNHQKKKRGNSPVSSFREKKTRKFTPRFMQSPAYCCERFASPPVPGVMLWWTYICRLDPKMAHDWGNRSINLSCFILIATHSSHWNLKMILNLFDILRAISKNDSHSRKNENMISNQHDTILYTYED